MDPSGVVQRQVDAYNAHDLDAFAATYSPDAQYIRHPSGEVVIRGIDQIRRNFGELFANSPNVHAHIGQRIAHGNFVVDDERVTGRAGLPDGYVIAIYEVRADYIQNVWIIRA